MGRRIPRLHRRRSPRHSQRRIRPAFPQRRADDARSLAIRQLLLPFVKTFGFGIDDFRRAGFFCERQFLVVEINRDDARLFAQRRAGNRAEQTRTLTVEAK